MLRIVMGNICQGHSQSGDGQQCQKVAGSPGGQRKDTRKNQENERRNRGYGGKIEQEHVSEMGCQM